MAPPAIRPLANSTPGPDSTWASDCCRACARHSISHRTRPPANIADEVEIGRETPTATGSADRKSGVEGKRGDLGGRRIIKKKKKKEDDGRRIRRTKTS